MGRSRGPPRRRRWIWRATAAGPAGLNRLHPPLECLPVFRAGVAAFRTPTVHRALAVVVAGGLVPRVARTPSGRATAGPSHHRQPARARLLPNPSCQRRGSRAVERTPGGLTPLPFFSPCRRHRRRNLCRNLCRQSLIKYSKWPPGLAMEFPDWARGTTMTTVGASGHVGDWLAGRGRLIRVLKSGSAL